MKAHVTDGLTDRLGLPPVPDSRDVPDLCHAVPRPGKTSPATLNVPDFKLKSKQRKEKLEG